MKLLSRDERMEVGSLHTRVAGAAGTPHFSASWQEVLLNGLRIREGIDTINFQRHANKPIQEVCCSVAALDRVVAASVMLERITTSQ